MSVAVVINTSCLGPHSTTVLGSDGRYAPHALRAYALRNWLIPAYRADKHIAELIVVGEYEPGPGYTYIHCPSVYFGSPDALAQRHAAFQATSAEWVIFQHDDHILDANWALQLDKRFDVISPTRYTLLRDPNGERLNNGEPTATDSGYVSGHCAAYQRHAIETCPWSKVPAVRTWDRQHTWQLRDAGMRIAFSATLRVRDIEFGSQPWL